MDIENINLGKLNRQELEELKQRIGKITNDINNLLWIMP